MVDKQELETLGVSVVRNVTMGAMRFLRSRLTALADELASVCCRTLFRLRSSTVYLTALNARG